MQSAELLCAVMCSSKTVKRLRFMLCKQTVLSLSFLSSSHEVFVYTPGRPLAHGFPSALASRAGITGICYHTQLLSLSVLMASSLIILHTHTPPSTSGFYVHAHPHTCAHTQTNTRTHTQIDTHRHTLASLSTHTYNQRRCLLF